MDSIFLLYSFILGAIIGSFLNVIIYRYKTGMTLGGRSKCFTCDRTLSWVELFPILSFIIQKGACRKCKSRISWQYPLVEIATGLLFILVFYYFPPTSPTAVFFTSFYLLVTGLLVVITVYDARHKIIPNELVYTFAALAFLKLFIAPDLLFVIPNLWQVLAGPILALPFALLWLVSRGTWMGLGDAKLVLGIGWLLGLNAGISAIILSFWIGGIISVLWMLIIFKKFKKNLEIPFGPYLIIGMYLVLFFHISVIDLSLLRDLLSSSSL